MRVLVTAAARLSVGQREYLARRMGVVAQHLAFAVRQEDPVLVEEILSGLSVQETWALLVVQAAQAPPPLSRPEDGIFDEIAVARAAAGGEVPLTRTEQDEVMRRLHDRGQSLRQIGDRFGLSPEGVRKAINRPTPKQGDLLREVANQ